jgi:hypothetical protein
MTGQCRNVTSVANAAAGLARAALSLLTSAVGLVLAAALPAAVGAQTTSSPDPKPFVVRISEDRVDNGHGVTSTACVLVSPDGRFHLERRQQVLPSSTAVLKVFESSLDSSQLQQLRDILRNEPTGSLPEYDKQPIYFQNAPWFSSVTVEISAGEAARRAVYWSWDERSAGPAASAEVKKHWKDAETALRPLVEWLHGIEALKLAPS